ncbi:hypothetical protein KIW84_010239 [Lathyrus oleraceus]|uniref:Uncharacterized protein n=1 Tax=Pisum sativum TaxID=3888 RepID=A0A9D4YKN3_PEA|nr:hypothetical protein KIW84_010239 [Pisum sativum]
MYSMDDFVETRKRAIVSVDTPKGGGYLSDVTGREIVPVEQDFGIGERYKRPFDWLQIVLNAMLEEKRISKRSLDELFDDIKIALGCVNHSTACKSDITRKSIHPGEFDPFHVNSFSGFIEAVHRIIKLIEGIAPMRRIKIQTESRFRKFCRGSCICLDWSINKCTNSTNAPIAMDKIKKHLNYFLSVNENQIDVDDKQSFCTPSSVNPDDRSDETSQYDFVEEIRKLKDDLTNTKSAKKDLEVKLMSVIEEKCQESIINIEKQLEALASSSETSVFDKVTSATSTIHSVSKEELDQTSFTPQPYASRG